CEWLLDQCFLFRLWNSCRVWGRNWWFTCRSYRCYEKYVDFYRFVCNCLICIAIHDIFYSTFYYCHDDLGSIKLEQLTSDTVISHPNRSSQLRYSSKLTQFGHSDWDCFRICCWWNRCGASVISGSYSSSWRRYCSHCVHLCCSIYRFT